MLTKAKTKKIRVKIKTDICCARANEPKRGPTNITQDCKDPMTPIASPTLLCSTFLTISLLYPTCISDPNGTIENHPRINIHHCGAISIKMVHGIIPRLIILRSCLLLKYFIQKRGTRIT